MRILHYQERTMIFQMQEGYLTLATGDWQDRTVNMLSANHLPVKGTNLVVTREALPDGLCLVKQETPRLCRGTSKV